MTTIQTIRVHDLSLAAASVHGAPYVAIRPICDSLGLDWSSQRKRINRDPELGSCVVVMTTQLPGDTQARKVVYLPLSRLNGWLFGVDAARVREDLRERMTWYRSECYGVLARHFGLVGGDDLADLRRQLSDAEAQEDISFARARACSLGMNRRRREKPLLLQRIDDLRELVQLTLPLDTTTTDPARLG